MYDNTFQKLLTLINLNINLELLVFLLRDLNNFTQLNNFSFLKLDILPKTKTITNNYKLNSNLYFTDSLKELIKFRYNFTKKELEERILPTPAKIVLSAKRWWAI